MGTKSKELIEGIDGVLSVNGPRAGFGVSAIDNWSDSLALIWNMNEAGAADRVDEIQSFALSANSDTSFTSTTGHIGPNAANFERDNNDYLEYTVGTAVDGSSEEAAAKFWPVRSGFLSVWVNPESVPTSGNSHYIFHLGEETNPASFFHVFLYHDGNDVWLQAETYAADTSAHAAYKYYTFSTSTWYHICVFFDSVWVRLFVDGAELGAQNVNEMSPGMFNPSPIANSGQANEYSILVGDMGAGNQGAGNGWDGAIDQTAFFSDPQFNNEEEMRNLVIALYNSGSGVAYS